MTDVDSDIHWHRLLAEVVAERDAAQSQVRYFEACRSGQIARMPDKREDLVEAIVIHLRELHCSQWGRTFGIDQDEGRYVLAHHLTETLFLPVLEQLQ